VSEDIPEPSLPVRALLLSLYLALMLGAGLLHGLVVLVPRARKDDLEGWAEWFYDGCARVAEFAVALRLHLRCPAHWVRRVRCPRCHARAEVLFEPDGRRFEIRGRCAHLGGNFPLLVSPPGWWQRHVRPEDWCDE
jgi:hypothetical protein